MEGAQGGLMGQLSGVKVRGGLCLCACVYVCYLPCFFFLQLSGVSSDDSSKSSEIAVMELMQHGVCLCVCD